MKFIDMFAGIGGMRSGLEQAGMTCVGHIEWDKFAQQSYKAIYSHGREEEYEREFCGWDITEVKASDLPRADLWAFGAPCQDFSMAGKRAGLDGGRSSLIREVFRLIREASKEHRPQWLIYENVKGMFSTNGGGDFAAILLEMEALGYDLEWQLLNTKHYGRPQNRERVYLVGHLRSRGGRKVFPIRGTGVETGLEINVLVHRDGYRRNTQVFDPNGITETLDTAQGGGRMAHTINVIGTLNENRATDANVLGIDGISGTLLARDYKGPKMVGIPKFIPTEDDTSKTLRTGGKGSLTAKHAYDLVAIGASRGRNPENTSDRTTGAPTGQRFEINEDGVSNTLTTVQKDNLVCYSILRPKRTEYGKAIRKDYENGFIKESRHNMTRLEPATDGVSNTLTTVQKDNLLLDQRYIDGISDKHSFAKKKAQGMLNEKGELPERFNPYNAQKIDEVSPTLTANCDRSTNSSTVLMKQPNFRIRKLTPKECWRLQGFEDWQFDLAKADGVSDSQLYKQAGNAVSVVVAKAVGDAIIKAELEALLGEEEGE